jgi:hypothetical protein
MVYFFSERFMITRFSLQVIKKISIQNIFTKRSVEPFDIDRCPNPVMSICCGFTSHALSNILLSLIIFNITFTLSSASNILLVLTGVTKLEVIRSQSSERSISDRDVSSVVGGCNNRQRVECSWREIAFFGRNIWTCELNVSSNDANLR